jgi:hypothetical protein
LFSGNLLNYFFVLFAVMVTVQEFIRVAQQGVFISSTKRKGMRNDHARLQLKEDEPAAGASLFSEGEATAARNEITLEIWSSIVQVELPHDIKVSMDYFKEIEEYRSVGDECPEAKILM